MAERDLARFGDAVADEAVFYRSDPICGARQVVNYWARWFEGAGPFFLGTRSGGSTGPGTLALEHRPRA